MTYKTLAQHALEERNRQKPIADILREYNLTIAEWIVLGIIRSGINQTSTIAQNMETSLAYVTNIVNSLARKKLAVREKSLSDLRSNKIVSKLKRETYEIIDQRLQEVLDGMYR